VDRTPEPYRPGAPDAAAPAGQPVLEAYDPDDGYDLYDAAGTPQATPTATTVPAPAPRRLATVLGVTGELLITLGVVICLYLVYELWWSNLTAAAQTRHNSAALLQQLQAAPAVPVAHPSDTIAPGTGFAFLYIPALGPDWRALIMQGTDRTTVLNTGAVGHYTDPASAFPWDSVGDFAIAGHRDGHGMIFRDLDQLHPGDRVYVQTEYGWFVYQLDREAASVSVNDLGAVAPIPEGSGYTEPGRYITMTTCTPIYIDTNRLIWWGHLVSQTPEDQVPKGVTPTS
jgi:sortase A